MALQATYVRFLAAPNAAALAPEAALQYITSTTCFQGADNIISHLGIQRNTIKKVKENVISSVEGQNGLAIQTEVSLNFMSSGGAYLPKLDDNFLPDRDVTFPVIHMVTFDNNDKILRIQQTWDQASLLKNIEVIGASGRNWPISDVSAQLDLLNKSSQPAQNTQSSEVAPSRGNSRSATRDPYSTLHSLHDDDNLPQVVSPYAGSRPQQRTFTDILGDQSEDPSAYKQASIAPKAGSGRNYQVCRLFDAQGPDSDVPETPVAPKIGAGKNYAPSRLFNEDVAEDTTESEQPKPPARNYKPHPDKYNHFDFADGSEPADAPTAGVQWEALPASKHRNGWNFEDFTTPAKPRFSRTTRNQEVRHWGTDENDNQESPIKGYVQETKPRRDAETHFEMQDDGPRTEPRVTGPPRGSAHNDGLGLYKNNVMTDEDYKPSGIESRPLGNITNLSDRSKSFNKHFDMMDELPDQANSTPKPPVPEDRKKVVKMMEANWSSYDKSPSSQKENSHPMHGGGSAMPDQGIKLGGDGMGNPKGGRGWSLGDNGEDTKPPANVPGKKAGAQQISSLWDM